MHVPTQTLDVLLEQYNQVLEQIAQTTDVSQTIALSKKLSEMEKKADLAKTLRAKTSEYEDLKEMLAEDGIDAEFALLAKADLEQLEADMPLLHKTLALALLPKDEADEGGVVLEIRAGTGGDEAAIFAGDLYRMYARYALLQGWKVEIISQSDADMGGFKEIIAEISGESVYAMLKYESGVHRVQRVPLTETQGRIHTSAATVAVLPEATHVDFEIQESDLRIDVYRASGAGGQHVNKTESAVRITHIPTGAVVAVQDDRSQHRNRAKAMQLLKAKLYDQHRLEQENARSADRKSQIGSGDRSERIRTYNYPQGRLTDHRIGLTLYSLERIVAGDDLGQVIGALKSFDEEERLNASANAF